MNDDDFSPRTRAVGAAFKVVVIGLAVVFLGFLGWGVLALLDIAETNKANGDLIIECTTPPEERHPPVQLGPRVDDCFLRTSRQQAANVGEIGNLSTIAAACGAANPGDIPKTRECVDRAIEEFPPVPREEVP